VCFIQLNTAFTVELGLGQFGKQLRTVNDDVVVLVPVSPTVVEPTTDLLVVVLLPLIVVSTVKKRHLVFTRAEMQ